MLDIKPLIASKTDQFNSDDLKGRADFIITGASIDRNAKNQGPLTLTTNHPSGLHYRPGKAMMRMFADKWGEDASQFVGRRLIIFTDPHVENLKKDKVGGIRVCGMSHVDGDFQYRAKTGRGTYTMYNIQALPNPTPAGAQRGKPSPIEAAVAHGIKQGLTVEDLQALVGCEVGAWGDAELSTLRGWFERIKAKTATIDEMRAARPSDEVPDAS